MLRLVGAVRRAQQSGNCGSNVVTRVVGGHVRKHALSGATRGSRMEGWRVCEGPDSVATSCLAQQGSGSVRSYGTRLWHVVCRSAGEVSRPADKLGGSGPGMAAISGLAGLRGARSMIQKVTVELPGLQGQAQCAGRRIPQNLLAQQSQRVMSTTTTGAAAAAGSTAIQGARALVTAGPAAQKQVSMWLFGCAGWVFSMVVLGGATRLTRSGLSMTDWKFTGSLPPINEAEWEKEFERYKQSPEYKRVHRWMSVEDFKFIFYMEYIHRMWGRGLGFFFALPCAFFLKKGYITKPLGARLALLFGAGGGQGLVGWWMVKSGLEEPETEWKEPRVSPYRLAAHLTVAFSIYSGLIWTGLSVASPAVAASLSPIASAALLKTRRLALPLCAVIGITAISGAFVAGNDAGRAFNTFPMMGEHWVPEGMLQMQPMLRNFFENTATVQFQHRMLAYATTAGVVALWATTRRLPLPPTSQLLVQSLLGVTMLQVTLGITTLLTYVPASLGTAHQAGALTLFTIALALMHSLRRPSAIQFATATRAVNAAGLNMKPSL
ncbi:hypothetical protein CBR_g24146 [Chara braunii]|uniref:Uncharacterized protein n=1 Tax=Chara braunii TaxID=69332 RepID=A0A388L5X2_CHABU|nr:hypothetical protein CBR_g24146 [Chara braunii]|eukprot:GBG77700.1 hypothetical protein CBR_g24146 [Chara braunii]